MSRSALASGLALLLAAAGAAHAQPREPLEPAYVEAVSLLGEPLVRPAAAPEFRAAQEALLAEAEAALARDPADAEALIWKGRRLAYLGRYGEAIAAFEAGAKKFPDDARFPRHLGHRFITVRNIDAAKAALARAAALAAFIPDEIEPDGLPNPANIPTSTLKANIFYHLALAQYLDGSFAEAADNWRMAAAVSTNPDMGVASRYWLAISAIRLDDEGSMRAALAPIVATLELIENEAYFALAMAMKEGGDAEALLAAARSEGDAAFATTGYGVAMIRLRKGDRAGAKSLLEEIVAGGAWPSFGHIAAEADLARGF